MAALIPFDFESSAVRALMIDGLPWFVAVDVCRVLEHSNPTVALGRLDDDEKAIFDPKQLLGSNGVRGGAQTMNIVSQSGLFALILTSSKPAAKRFRKWVTAEVLPALLRDGSYSLTGSDRARLEAGRAYFHAVPEKTRAIADSYVEAIRMVEDMIAGGLGAWPAVQAVCALKRIPERTLYAYREKVRMVPEADWGAATVRQYHRPRGMLAKCHPEALQFFRDLKAGGLRVSDCYRRMADEAAARGWSPIPTQRTMYRVGERTVPVARLQ